MLQVKPITVGNCGVTRNFFLLKTYDCFVFNNSYGHISIIFLSSDDKCECVVKVKYNTVSILHTMSLNNVWITLLKMKVGSLLCIGLS